MVVSVKGQVYGFRSKRSVEERIILEAGMDDVESFPSDGVWSAVNVCVMACKHGKVRFLHYLLDVSG